MTSAIQMTSQLKSEDLRGLGDGGGPSYKVAGTLDKWTLMNDVDDRIAHFQLPDRIVRIILAWIVYEMSKNLK